MHKLFKNEWVVILAIVTGVLVMIVLIIMLLAGRVIARLSADPGYEVVIVDYPYVFGDGGVRQDTLKYGAMWTWGSAFGYAVDIRPSIVKITLDDLSTQDNVLLDFDATVTYRVTDPVLLMKKFGITDWWEKNLQRVFMSEVRAAVKTRSMSDMMSNTVTGVQVDDVLTKALRAKVLEIGIPIEITDINLGKATPNAQVLEQMNKTAEQQQAQKTWAQATEAEKARADSERARAEADKAYQSGRGLTTEQYLQLQLADKQIAACKAAATCILNPLGGIQPTISAR